MTTVKHWPPTEATPQIIIGDRITCQHCGKVVTDPEDALRLYLSGFVALPCKGCKEDKGRKAFTLIELLLVVAVIAVLIGILLPAMASARESARNAKYLAHLHTIGQSFADYRGNHRGDAPLPDDLELDAAAWACPCFAARNRDSTQPHFTQWSFTNPRVYGAVLDTRPAATWPITGDMTAEAKRRGLKIPEIDMRPMDRE